MSPRPSRSRRARPSLWDFRNKPLGNLVIEKWGRNGTKTVPLEGVKFEIKYADGRYVDDGGGTLSSKGHLLF